MLFKDNIMKHELRQFLEKEFQSYDDLKGLSERLKTSAAAIETMIAPDSHNDVNLAGVNKSAANLILSALFQGKPYESGEYKPQKSIDIPFCRESIFRANLETICRELEALKKYAGDKTTFETTLETEKKIYQRISEVAEKLRYFLDKDKEARLKAYKESPLFERNIFDNASYEVVIPKELTSTLRQIAIINDTVTALDKLAENVLKEFKPLSCDSELSDFRETVDEIKAKLKARKEKILTPVVKPEISNAAAAIEKAFKYWSEKFSEEQPRARMFRNIGKPSDQDANRIAFPEIKADEVKKELEKRQAEIKELEEIKHNSKEMREATNRPEMLTFSDCIKDLAEGQNKIATILQKRLQNGNI